MKRYRVLQLEFDFTANLLLHKIGEDTDEETKVWHQEQIERVRKRMEYRYGSDNLDEKVQNLQDIGAQAMSVISFHNNFYRQARHAFIVGVYYPALTATCALGERILNELVLALRSYYPTPMDHPEIATHKSFANWTLMIDALEGWGILLSDVTEAFRALTKTRHRTLHFNPVSQDEVRVLAVDAIQRMNLIIHRQFGILGLQPWFIPGIRGASYIAKSWEDSPYVETFLLPHSALVGPRHQLNISEDMFMVTVQDEQYDERELTDEEFRDMVDPGWLEEQPLP